MVERLGSVLMYGLFVCLFIVGSLLVDGRLKRSEAATPFVLSIDEFPDRPIPHNPTDWDVVVHSRDPQTWQLLDEISAAFSPTCDPATRHTLTRPQEAVFVCDGTVQTALNARGYGMIYQTPNQMVDFGQGEAIIRFDVSTLRSDARDFLNIWVTPFESNLQLPAEDWLPVASGEPRDGLQLKTGMTHDQTHIAASVVRDFDLSRMMTSEQTLEELLAENGVAPSGEELETFEIRLSAEHLSLCLPTYDECLIDTPINPPLDWSRGVVQFGHHSWHSEQSNTYRWDNFYIEPAIPFGMVKANNRNVNPFGDTFTFAAPAPANSYLRFTGIGEHLQVSFDNGVTWQTAQLQQHEAGQYDAGRFRTYWMPIPPTVQTVKVRGNDWWGGNWFAHTASIWTLSTSIPEITPLIDVASTDTNVALIATPTLIATVASQAVVPQVVAPQAVESTPQLPIEITFGNISGVSGYEVGIFGQGFGDSGNVTIRDAYATILEWEDGFIRAVVPSVGDGTGELRVIRQNGDVASTPFTVYSIDPQFLQPPEKTFAEISFDQTLFLDGVEFAYCNNIADGAPIEAGRFLTNYRCGSGGYVGSGEAVFAADSSLGTTATIAFQSPTTLSGEHIFQFAADTYWEPYHESQADWRSSYPRAYAIEVSADSTNGTDGTWTTLQTITDNDRTTRYHSVSIPSAGNYQWIRMHITDGYADYSAPAGRDFLLRQIHIYKATGTGRPDSIAIFGDSLTYSAFEIIGPRGFAASVQNQRLADGALPLTLYGLPGAKADRLMDTDYFESDIYDAFAIDNMGENALYWGVALGTNDIGGGAVNLNDPNSFLMQFDERLDGAVQALIGRGRVPIIARMPDTDESNGGYGDTASKQKVLADIDTIAATYRLIPGPDLFTLFRRDITTNNASFIGDDGTHHSYEGREALIDAWVAAFTAPFPQDSNVPTPEPTATTTATATPPPNVTPTLTSTPAPTTEPVATSEVPPSDTGIEIEVANQASVIGYEVGIFGSGFGEVVGSVAILGESAEISEWTNTFVRVTVPAVPDGQGVLHLQSSGGLNAYAPFTVYTIDPAFLQAPEVTFENIAAGKFVHTQNLESSFCYQQPENVNADASEFLTSYRCGYAGITRTGSAKFKADSSRGEVGIVAVDLAQELSGDYYFSYFVNGSWYPRADTGTFPESNPRDYELQISADSTDGIDGTWQTVATITGNNRSQRTHKLTVPSGGFHWFRMRVTDGNADETGETGRDFGLREIRLFAPKDGSTGTLDSFVIYGDSLTASNFETIGTLGLAAKVREIRGVEQAMMLTTFGLAGQNSSGFVNQTDITYDIYDALALDNMQQNARFWGIGIGTNDALDQPETIGLSGFNITEYSGRLDAVVADLVAMGRVPIVARIPDTDESRGGYGTLATKRKLLADIDTIAAKYRLIPGPDLYTEFRLNIETEGSSYLGGDGTHHSDAGMLKMIDMWGEAFVTAVPAVPSTTPLPTPLPTYTPIAQPSPTLPPATATPLAPTPTPLPPTATSTPLAATATNTPVLATATNTPLPATTTPVPSPTPVVESVIGDVSCDVQRNVEDALFISEYIVNSRTANTHCPLVEDTLNLTQCDVDNNGACDVADAMYVAQCEAGVSNELCVQQRAAERAVESAAARLRLAPVNAGQLAISVDLPGGNRFGAMTVDVHFDPTLVRPIGCEIDNELVGACNLSFANDTVRFAGAAFLPERGFINYGNVYFAPLENGTTSAEITASAQQLNGHDGAVYNVSSATETVLLESVPTAIALRTSQSATTYSLGLFWTIVSLLILFAGLLAFGVTVVFQKSRLNKSTKTTSDR